MLVLHANWVEGSLRLWGESLEAYVASPRFAEVAVAASGVADDQSAVALADGAMHPFAASAEQLRQRLPADLGAMTSAAGLFRLRLPRDPQGPWPSDRLARRAGAIEMPIDPWLGEFEVPNVGIANEQALVALPSWEEHEQNPEFDFAPSLRFWMSVANFVSDLLADQRFIPTLVQSRGDGLRGSWQPWLHDEDVRKRLAVLIRSMPPSVRATVDRHQGKPWSILEEAMRMWTDAFVRSALAAEQFTDALEDRDPLDPHVAWLTGLLGLESRVQLNGDGGLYLLRDAAQWVSRLDDASQERAMRLCLKLSEPGAGAGSDPQWPLTLHLQSPEDPEFLIAAEHIWSQVTSAAGRKNQISSVENPQELLLAELGRCSRVYPRIEAALSEQHPTTLLLTTAEAYEFLREAMPLLEESGFGVIAPEWWDQPLGRLAARLHIDAPTTESLAGSSAGTAPAASMLGLNSLVKFTWQIAIGDQPLSMEEFHALAKANAPLVQVRGKWIEISSQQIADAREFLEKTPAGEMTLLEAIRLAHGGDPATSAKSGGLPIMGMDATGWVADLFAASTSGENQNMPMLEQPAGFLGTLRPYQKTGLSWLAFLDRFGLGACLADDMGLGKTIQLIALLQHERQVRGQLPIAASNEQAQARLAPTLLVVPTSVVANWVRELERFAPELTTHVQHGPERPVGDRFLEVAAVHDVVITTYPLISRDIETLKRIRWHRVALDEAQYIKNPPTKQTTAIRSLHAPHRLALTGTPVENRLSELWSIMEFCNPGYLGAAGEFRRRFGIPVERHRNRLQAERLRQMVRPFVLRRVKTDPKVIDDLPDCTETKDYATLTVEQAGLYQQTVDAMLGQVEKASGIQRRGLVLATLVKLKQICNHPAQSSMSAGARLDDLAKLRPGELVMEDDSAPEPQISTSQNVGALSGRSGKAKRLMVMLEEVIASEEKALIFTQFRQMGHLLTAMIQNDLDCEALFLHGGTPANKRQALIDRFQDEKGGAPIFVLSLKAGGLGLNLTAANHVFHYDRWWNPAVENQATDRAYRIGQRRAVHVHKFVCQGTLEERIDQMIEQKTELAQNIIGAGEQWLTELSTGQLHELLMLRPSAMEGES